LTSTYQLPADERELLNESARMLSQGRPGEAATKLLALQKKHPDNVDVAINLGGAYILQRKWDGAVKVLKRALESHPDNAMLWTNLAAAELGVLESSGPQQQDRAIAAYQRALEIEPAAPNVHYHLGLIYKERGELLRALAFFQAALDVLPTDRDAQHWIDRITVINERVEIDRARKAAEPESPASAEDLNGTVGE
jgi:tetratricopeptide (TPR) repeat protein